MAGVFSGTPQTATSYTTSTTETPKWMQDAIYTQVQIASNLAAQPYQAYDANKLVAGLQPQQLKAYENVSANQGAWQPTFNTAQQGTQNLTTAPGGMQASQPYLNQAVNTSGINAAQPYLQNASQSSVSDINNYMNPYTQNVTDRIAQLGARNLTENLLPGVSDAFIKAGSFGGTRMGEFGNRALRDSQESILGQQGQALQQGYTQALGASQADLARQAQLASTSGNLTNAQQQALLSAGQQAGSLTQSDLSRQQSALAQLATMAGQGQQMRTADTAALEAAGAAQQQVAQKQADAAYQQWQNAQLYPRQMADWLSTQVRGMAPITPTTTTNAGSTTGQTYSASPLSQLASAGATGAGLYKLSQGG
jgi:hypothetical protein